MSSHSVTETFSHQMDLVEELFLQLSYPICLDLKSTETKSLVWKTVMPSYRLLAQAGSLLLKAAGWSISRLAGYCHLSYEVT